MTTPTPPGAVMPLLPCPFCGGEIPDNQGICFGVEPKAMHFVDCQCGVRGPVGSTMAESQERWNRRPSPPAVEARAVAWQYRCRTNMADAPWSEWRECSRWQAANMHDGDYVVYETRALCPCSPPAPAPEGWDFVQAMKACEAGLETWRSQNHNRKWWKLIDGTPIPNDLLCCIAEAVRDMSLPAAPQSGEGV